MNKKFLLLGIIALTMCGAALHAQVTIGLNKEPETFSVLELISNGAHGLRLPLMTTEQRDAMTATDEFQAKAKAEAEGLTIFNTDTKCVEIWNGSQWISMCQAGTIDALGCASVNVNVTQGTFANETSSLPYTGLAGTSIDLPDGQILGGPVSGLSVMVYGAQTLSAANGNVSIKITGTATTYGAINIPVNLSGASCDINVNAAQQNGAIGSLGCASVIGINVTEGTAANETASLPYYDLTGASIALTDGQVLGSVSGLSVQVNGAQTLSATNGNIAIKITGTAVTNGTINIPVSLAGATCSIGVTSSQQGGVIGTLECSSITGVNVTQGITANVTVSLPFSNKTGADIALANGTTLGTISGLSVVANGDQNLVTPGGDIAIKITGTPTISGTIKIPVSLAGASCEITVTSAVNPATLQAGYGTFTGRTCFDVVMTNEGGDCGTIASRLPQKADFTLPTIYTQVYTFTASGNVSNVRFYVSDPSGKVVQSYTPTGYSGTTNNGATRTVTVSYYTDLNDKAKGLSRSNALTAILYVVYTDGAGIDRRLQLQVSIQDCSCCPGYLRTNGEYTQTASSLSFAAGSNFATVSSSFRATGNAVCFFMKDYPNGTIIYSTANSYCTSGSSNLAPYASMGWRVPNIAELGNIQTWALSLSTQPTSVAGTTNMVTTPPGGGTGYAYYVSSSVSSTGVTYGWSYGQAGTQMVSVGANARCVFTLK